MKHGRYSLYKKKGCNGSVWYARFWNESERAYTIVRSTGIRAAGKKGRMRAADDAARAMLEELCYNPTNKLVIQYLEDFWRPNSQYVRECETLKKAPLSAGYIKSNAGLVKYHIKPFPGFQCLHMIDLTAGIIRNWMLWEAEHGVSAQQINKALQAFRVAVRDAISREEMKHDPFERVTPAVFQSREKGVLTEKEVKMLLDMPENSQGRAILLLGVLCGMRMGEIRGLYWEDIQGGEIVIQHNYQDLEGIKSPKCKSGRTVPLPEIIKNLLGTPGTGLVFGSEVNRDKPVSCGYIRNIFVRTLEAIGIPGEWQGKAPAPEGYVNEQQRRILSFHSLRHTFITLGRKAGISEFEIRALAGHKSNVMMERYSHASQVIDLAEARKKIEKAVGL
jgi:integrase